MAGSLRHLVIVIVSLTVPYLCVGLTCLKCTGVSIPRNCGQTQTCGAHQICFIEKTSSSAGIRYNMGCRDGHLCTTQGRRSAAFMTSPDSEPTRSNSTDEVILRSSRSICDTCCTSNLCNSGGCGATGYLPRLSRGPVCYSCAQRSTPQSCDTVTVCGKNSSLCQGHGAYLAEVGDTSEESFLVQVGPTAHQGDWWLGGVKHGTTWRWDHSGHSLTTGSWGPHRPSNNGNNCLEIQKTLHTWNNEDCNHHNYYICEKP